jgi:hypothetical protein
MDCARDRRVDSRVSAQAVGAHNEQLPRTTLTLNSPVLAAAARGTLRNTPTRFTLKFQNEIFGSICANRIQPRFTRTVGGKIKLAYSAHSALLGRPRMSRTASLLGTPVNAGWPSGSGKRLHGGNENRGMMSHRWLGDIGTFDPLLRSFCSSRRSKSLDAYCAQAIRVRSPTP